MNFQLFLLWLEMMQYKRKIEVYLYKQERGQKQIEKK